MPEKNKDQHILRSWQRNAGAWSCAVREARIDSRRLVTDAAVVEAILASAPNTVLDVGCGEGWLARRLVAQGVQVTGVDAIAELTDSARQLGGGDFLCLPYEQLCAQSLKGRFDLAVCNFSLLGERDVAQLLETLPSLLNSAGKLVIQTLHPLQACGEQRYCDGWREGSWDGFGSDFTDPPPWYFRTLGSWLALIRDSGFSLQAMQEPLHPQTGKPASVIFIASAG